MVMRLNGAGDVGQARRKLAAALASANPNGCGDDNRAAWAMRRCFDELLAGASDPGLAEGMPTAAQIRREAGFPNRMDAGSSSCCVIA